MAIGEKIELETRLNDLRSRFLTPKGLLDNFVLRVFRQEVETLKNRGYYVVLDDNCNRLVIV